LRVLVLGGYGFIGREISNRLIAAGHEIVLLGRNAGAVRRMFPQARWVSADLGDVRPDDVWRARLDGIDAVVNAAGALQEGARDHLEAVHHLSVAALVRACESRGVATFVQISAVGARLDATTEFMRSKARGDLSVRSSSLRWLIVRPGLVIGANAYGGTALIRMLAGVPVVQPIAFGDAAIQTVSMRDLAEVVLDAVEARLPGGAEFDLVEAKPHSLRETTAAFRRWLGFREARWVIEAPRGLARGVAKIADALGYLGWRSPFRTTALRVLADGVLGDPRPFARLSPRAIAGLDSTLAALPATLQERWFARLYLAMPVTVGTLASFWALSGFIALLHVEEAARMTGLAEPAARLAVVVGAVVDLALGAAILYRPWARFACCAMALVSALYVFVGTGLRPDLWGDPFGPLLKIVPILVLALVAALLVEDR
jgi:uncharacterized protein YbjT (DUF2867 family)